MGGSLDVYMGIGEAGRGFFRRLHGDRGSWEDHKHRQNSILIIYGGPLTPVSPGPGRVAGDFRGRRPLTNKSRPIPIP